MTDAAVDNEPATRLDAVTPAPAVDEVIRRYVAYASASGLIPLPLVEFVTSSTIQLKMIDRLCTIYGVDFSENLTKASIASLIGGLLPISPFGYGVASLARAIPVVGPILSLVTVPVLAGAATWAIGRVFAGHFARGGTLADFDASRKRVDFVAEFEEGRRRVS